LCLVPADTGDQFAGRARHQTDAKPAILHITENLRGYERMRSNRIPSDLVRVPALVGTSETVSQGRRALDNCKAYAASIVALHLIPRGLLRTLLAAGEPVPDASLREQVPGLC